MEKDTIPLPAPSDRFCLLLDDGCLPFEENSPADVAGTPADAIALWNEHHDRSVECARAVAAMVDREERRVADLSDLPVLQETIERFLQGLSEKGRPKLSTAVNALYALAALAAANRASLDAIGYAEEAFNRCLHYGDAESPEVERMVERLTKLLGNLGEDGQAEVLMRRFNVEKLLLRQGKGACWSLRYEALKFVELKQYDAAIPIYQHLIKRGYCPAGTYCHLARVFFLLGKREEARAAVADAWRHRSEGCAYERGRVVFLRLLLEILDTKKPGASLAELKTALTGLAVVNHWLIQPMLDGMKEELGETMHTLLSAIGDALCDHSNLKNLEALDGWKNIG